MSELHNSVLNQQKMNMAAKPHALDPADAQDGCCSVLLRPATGSTVRIQSMAGCESNSSSEHELLFYSMTDSMTLCYCALHVQWHGEPAIGKSWNIMQASKHEPHLMQEMLSPPWVSCLHQWNVTRSPENGGQKKQWILTRLG